MFSQQDPVIVRLKEVYQTERHSQEFAVVANIYAAAPHDFTFSLRGDTGVMIPDGMEDAATRFLFAPPPCGCFSLASNATRDEAGAFRYIRLTANGETLLDMDFQTLQSVDELENLFDCYYFPDLKRDTRGSLVPIRQYWGLNARGYLQCIRKEGRIPINDCGPMCVLTLKRSNIGDFDAEVGVEQSYRRYGIVFGCEAAKFPYSSTLKTWETIVSHGGFAFLNSRDRINGVRGAVSMRPNGDMHDVLRSTPGLFCGRDTAALLQRFVSDKQMSLPRHSIAYHLNDGLQYVLPDRTFTAKAGDIVYLPPSVPCYMEGDATWVISVEFDCVDAVTTAPTLITPARPNAVRRMFDELMEIWYSNLPGVEYRAFSAFYRIIAELSQPPRDTAAIALQIASEYIDAHFADPQLSAKEIAKAADISESYLYQLFREEIQMSPKEYILRCRLQNACSLLKTRYYKVYEVAEKCGFPDVKYFSTIFKREMGIPPGKYTVHKTD